MWELEIDKDAEEPLGLVLPHPEPDQCGNQCIFCFVHQLPPGMRRSLYVKDEDYRFSYLYGAYVTLTNLDDAALERILAQRLSPLYVSVHATSVQLREQMLGRKGPAILEQMRRLIDGGIAIHTQVVICPGINDGEELERTFRDLLSLASGPDRFTGEPGLLSLAIVPVGLTGYRRRLPQLRPVSAEEAGLLLDWVLLRQGECLDRLGSRFVYAADELYLAAGRAFPSLTEYEDLPQLENGVGLVARFRAQAAEVLAQVRPLDFPRISLVTGESSAGELQSFCAELARRSGVCLEVIPVPNRFFGGYVTVTGLLTGSDILAACAARVLGEWLFLPDVLLREGTEMLLDDVTVDELERSLGVRIEIVPSEPWGIWDTLETLAQEEGDEE